MTAASSRAIATSLDGQWIAVRDGRELRVLSARDEAELSYTLDGDDAQIAFVGPPATLVIATPHSATLVQPPQLDPVARLEHGGAILAVTGSRCVIAPVHANPEGKATIVRVAERAAATQEIEVGAPIELAVGLDRNQVLFVVPKALAVWDAALGRPTVKLQLQLPPAPRKVGAAAGHLWAMRDGGHEIYVYRLSDGRPFQHPIGVPIDAVIAHPASPLLVVATDHGLARLHCFAHSIAVLDGTPYTRSAPLAQLVAGEAITLLGLPDGAGEPWRTPLTSSAVESRPAAKPKPSTPPPLASGDATRATEPMPILRDDAPAAPQVSAAPPPQGGAPLAGWPRPWRDALVRYAADFAGEPPDAPDVASLASTLGLATPASRALVALYAGYLVGRELSLAELARICGDWTEPLGRGELAELAMLRRKHGRVGLRTAVTDLLDGAAPRAIRLAGSAPTLRPGAHRVARDGRSDAEIEAALVSQLGQIAIVAGSPRAALLEARLRATTAVHFAVPAERPHPWPRDAGLVLVLYGAPSSWVADLPAL